jgi:predicted nucleotidyltransferase
MTAALFEVVGGKAVYAGRTLAEWVPEIVQELVHASDPERVILFGSVARADDGPDSDIDIMVVLRSMDYERRHDWAVRLRAALPSVLPVQVFVTDLRECERRRDVIGSMHYWPLREGRLLYERVT